jgi:hypothetical protein
MAVWFPGRIAPTGRTLDHVTVIDIGIERGRELSTSSSLRQRWEKEGAARQSKWVKLLGQATYRLA